MRKSLTLLLSLFLLTACESTVSFYRDSGELAKVDIELARTAEQRATGLMYRQSLCDSCGMLFDYTEPSNVSMWMKNTYIPLDMFFITEEGIVVQIFENTTPHSTELLKSSQPVRYVLETNAGFASQHNIQVGDRLK